MTSQEIQQFVYDYLYNKSLPHKAIVAIMGNITGESDWSPNLIEVGSGAGFGLCQWSFSRRTQLETYGTDLQHQCDFLWSELTGENTNITGAESQWISTPTAAVTGGESFTCSLNQFKTASNTIEFLTKSFCYCWERPAFSTNHLDSIRIPAALSFNTSMSYQGSGNTGGTNPQTGDIWTHIIASPYKINQLSTAEASFLQTLSIGNNIKLKYTFNHNKRQIGQNYTGNKLTFDDKQYTIKGVRNDGFIIISYSGSIYYKYVNPKYIMSI